MVRMRAWSVMAGVALALCAAGACAQDRATPGSATSSPFQYRGIKGLWWQGAAGYRRALPWLARNNLNFLMLCYSSFPASGADWRADYSPDEFREFGEIAARGDKLGVEVCLSFNPGLWSRPPLVYCSESDYQLALRKVRLVHQRGIRWFGLCLDDISRQLEPADQAQFGTLQAAQTHFVNRLWADMKGLRPQPRLIFCPSVYTTAEARQHLDYIKAVGAGISPEVMMFWTGPECCSPTITARDAREFGAWIQRKPFVWDNYPVNDMFPWRPLLAPLRNRSADLGDAVAGYLANPMKQFDAAQIPLGTTARYLTDPAHYEPTRALAEVVAGFRPHQRETVGQLVALYGTAFWSEPNFPPKPRPRTRDEAARLLPQYKALRAALSSTQGLKRLRDEVRPTLDEDIAALERKARDRLAVSPLRANGDEFEGGAGEVFGYDKYGRAVNYVYAKPTGRNAMQTEFALTEVPSQGAVLRLTARNDDWGTKVKLRIALNDSALHDGPSPYAPGDFQTLDFAVPATALRPGRNTLTLTNLEEQGRLGMPPWFMASAAELIPNQPLPR